jgi:hypothetical protein
MQPRLGLSVRLLAYLLGLSWSMLSTAGALEDIGKKLGFSKQPEFPIRESGYWTCEAPIGSCVYWLDNDRVIFNGAKPGDMETLPDGRSVSKHAIYIWDLNTNAVSKYADATRSILCYADGYIRYGRKDGAYNVVLAGPFGKEVEISRTHDKDRFAKRGEESTFLNRFTCKTYKQSEISPLPGARIPLKEGHGFLYLGAINSPDERIRPIVYFRHGAADGFPLPIMRWQSSSSGVRRSEFDDSYIIWGQPEFDRNDACLRPGTEREIFRLRLNGHVNAIVIPSDKRLRCYFNRFDTVVLGVLALGGGGHVQNLDLSKLYLLRNDQVTLVTTGVITDYRVSPDGCRMAVGISSNDDPRKPITAATYRGHLKVIEFCAKGGK